MRFSFSVIFSLCLILINNCYSQQYNYRNYTVNDGLPSMTIFNYAEDSKGFIWVVHENGVSKFDGYNFIQPNINNGLIYKEATSLIIDSKDRVWLMTAGPLCYIQNDSLYQLSDYPSPNHNRSFHIREDAKGNIWLFQKSNVMVLDGENLSLKKDFILPDEKAIEYGWIGERNDSIFVNGDYKLFVIKDYKVVDTINYNTLNLKKKQTRFLFPKLYKNKLYFSVDERLYYHNIKNSETKFLRTLPSYVYEFVLKDSELFLQLNNELLYRYQLEDPDTFTKVQIPLELENGGSIFVDSKNNIWVSTYKDGVLLIQPKSERVLDFFPQKENFGGYVECVYNDSQGNTWIGGENGSLFRLKKDIIKEIRFRGRFKSYSNRILGVEELDNSRVLVFGDEGIWLVDNNDEITYLFDAVIKDISVYDDQILVSTSSQIYLMPLEFLLRQEKLKITKEYDFSGELKRVKANRSLSNLLVDKNNYWIGNELEGLVNIKRNKTTYFKDSSGLFLSSINDIEKVDETYICVATKGAGLFIFDENNNYSRITTNNGLSSNICQDITSLNNKLYVATNRGLNILTSNDLFKKDFEIETVDISNGLQSNEIRSVSVNSDSIFLATTTGLEIVKQKRIDTEYDSIPFYITDIKINSESVQINSNYYLDSDQNDLQIEYVALDYGYENNIFYEYQLEGFDDEWIRTKDISIKYNNLMPGHYNFKLRLAKNHPSEKTFKIFFCINKPFYNKLWFRLLCVCLFLFITIGSIYGESLRRQKKLLDDRVKLKTRELDQQVRVLAKTNSRLEKSNEDLQNFAYVTSHDLKSPLRSIGSFLQLLEKKNKDQFDEKDKSYIKFSIDGVHRMYQTINDLLDYSALNTEASPIILNIKDVIHDVMKDLDFQIKDKNAQIEIYGEYPTLELHYFKIKQVFQNIIQNGIKYNKSENPIIKIFCKKISDTYHFEIHDNGIGIEKDYHDKIFKIFKRLHNDEEYQGSGVGLAICKRVIESYGGEIYVHSSNGVGTIFKFSIPENIDS